MLKQKFAYSAIPLFRIPQNTTSQYQGHSQEFHTLVSNGGMSIKQEGSGEHSYQMLMNRKCMYHIYPNKSRAHINAWARINAGVQHSKVNRHLYYMRKGLI